MKASAATIAAALVTSAVPAIAYPATLQTRDGETWKSDKGGNIQIEVGNDLILFGSALPSTTIDAILNQCGEYGCKPGEPLKVRTVRIGAGDMGQETELILTVEGSFATEKEPGDKAHLVEMAKTVMKKMFYEGKHKLKQDIPYYTKPCQQTKNGCIHKEKYYADQWQATDHVTVRYEDEKKSFKSFLNVGFSFEEAESLDGDICAGIVDIGSTMAEAISKIHPIAGVGFSLASFGCAFI
ncbi:hypothetical protein CGCVW01_v008369 [Colletotrichum viniferum]|nr:hypothetical protein CGCVW01_v008369 [Colletotrichum viniferum]